MKRKWLLLFVMSVLLGLGGCSSRPQEADQSTGDVKATVAEDTDSTDTKEPDAEADEQVTETTAQDTVISAEEAEPVIPVNGLAFSRTNYFYPESIEVEILSDKPGKIYYTVDGSDVSREKTIYEEPIRLEAGSQVKATCLKAKAYFEDGTESDTIVHTYFVGSDIATRYDTLIFSVTTDPYNLFDYEYGIFVEGKLRDDYIKENPGVQVDPDDPANFNMRGKAAEREVYLEVLKPDGTPVATQAAGIRTYGGWSRAREQKSFKIYARKEYDEQNNKLRYEFFPDRTGFNGSVLNNFKELVLRNCGNDNGFAFLRDELFQTLAGEAGYPDYEAVRPAAVYLNGEYRGFFWLHEVYCDEYFEDHYGKYDGKFEIVEGGETYKNYDAEGENTDIVDDYNDIYFSFAQMDLTDDTNYQKLCDVIDVKNYLEYYALQTYIGNEDWPHNNYKAYRYFTADGESYGEAPFDGRWRYLFHDLDFSYGIYGTQASTNFLAKYIGKDGEIMEACPLFGQLMKRPACKKIFVEKTLDLINGAFDPDHLGEVLDEMDSERRNELTNTYNKGLLEAWVTPDQLKGRMDDIKTWARSRAAFTISSYQSYLGLGTAYTLQVKTVEGCGVQVNSIVTDKDFEGTYYTDYDVLVIPVLPDGKQIDYWLVNGEKVDGDRLTVNSSMLENGRVEISFLVK